MTKPATAFRVESDFAASEIDTHLELFLETTRRYLFGPDAPQQGRKPVPCVVAVPCRGGRS